LEERFAHLPVLARNFDPTRTPFIRNARIEKRIIPASFEDARNDIRSYRFSDESIVRAHFSPNSPLLGRRMLLEIQVLGFHFLCPTVVSEVIDSTYDEEDVFGLRHDTLEGNIEAGTEWFVLKRNR